jgi:DNA-directed RNA polymerase III subunit RPC4
LFAPSSFSRQNGAGAAAGATFSGGSGGIKREGGGGGSGGSGGRSGGYDPITGVRYKDEIPEPIYPDEEEDGYSAPRVDIERINLVSDEEDEEPVVPSKGKGKAKQDKGGLRPVRLARHEHKERVTVLNTESSSTDLADKKPSTEGAAAADEGEGMFVRQDGEDNGMFVRQDDQTEKAGTSGKSEELHFTHGGQVWKGAWRDEDKAQIKTEPGLEEMDTDDIPMAEIEAAVQIDKVEPPTPQKKPRRKSSMKEKKPVLQTEEDREEWERHIEDVQILAEELGGLQTSAGPDAEGDVGMDADKLQYKDKEGRMYLFQFPPILPPLINPMKNEENDDIEMAEVSAAQSGTDGAKAAVDLTGDAAAVKQEPGTFQIPAELIPEAGLIGKLVVRESGKVELEWGGVSLELSRGAEMEFLSTTMIIDGLEDEIGDESVGKIVGSGSGLGSIKGKFVATPDWTKML